MEDSEVRQAVRERYAGKAVDDDGCCAPSCCGGETTSEALSRSIGYGDEELEAVPEGANLGLGCGNPVALAELNPGDVVVDLGSGAGFDCFLAAGNVGKTGRVIGVDMTPEMVEKARANAQKGDFPQVEFRLGEIEALPVGDDTADVIISNCVINLSANRDKVLSEAFRVLKPGGRLMISDLVSSHPVPECVAESKQSLVACLPVPKSEYTAELEAAGFADVQVEEGPPYPSEHIFADPQVEAVMAAYPDEREKVEAFVAEIRRGVIRGQKP
ncbi:MAG: arsenite methyltransferase [Longimicrobiales bacterium]